MGCFYTQSFIVGRESGITVIGKGFFMPQGNSQDSGTSSLEESILERYSKSADPQKKEEAKNDPEKAPSSLEEEILERYSDEIEETPLPGKAEVLSEETAPGSLEDETLQRYAQPSEEAEQGAEPSQAEFEDVAPVSQEEDILKRYAEASPEEELDVDEPVQGVEH